MDSDRFDNDLEKKKDPLEGSMGFLFTSLVVLVPNLFYHFQKCDPHLCIAFHNSPGPAPVVAVALREPR